MRIRYHPTQRDAETLRFYATHGFYFTQGLYDIPAFMIPRIFLCLLWCLRTRSKDATYTTATSDGPKTPRKGPRCHHDATRRLKMLLRADAAAHRRADDVPRHRPSVRPPAAHGPKVSCARPFSLPFLNMSHCNLVFCLFWVSMSANLEADPNS